MSEFDSVLVDELPVKSLPDRYGVSRSQVYNRIKALGIKTIKRQQKAYVNADQLALLDQIHKLLQQDYSLESAVMLILGESPQQGMVHVPQGVVEQSHGTAGQLEMMQMLIAAMAHQQPAAAPPPNPLSRFEQLQAIADHDWRPSTSELAAILGLNSLPGSSFERYGFRFTRAGKNGAQSAWKVEKIHD